MSSPFRETSSLYRAFVELDNGNVEEVIVTVPAGADIVEYVEAKMTKPFKIQEIHQIPKCSGCQYESLGQLRHMVHPDGCLHDRKNCKICRKYFYKY